MEVQAIEKLSLIANWIGGEEKIAAATFEKLNPHNGKVIFTAARSSGEEVDLAVQTAKNAHPDWAALTPVKRGQILFDFVTVLKAKRDEIAAIVALETGKNLKSALGETDAAISLGLFFAGEGQRFFGRTTVSGVPNRQVSMIRQPLGVAGLIIAANTPIANVAWKVFPALICGNTAVLKSAEDTPATAWIFAKAAAESGLPSGVLNIVHGLGPEAGAALAEHPEIDVLSFTGSTSAGKEIAQKVAAKSCRLSLELGGKNPFVVCDDASLDEAVHWAIQSVYSNAGQRCASAGRVIVMDAVYDAFRSRFLEAVKALRVGPSDEDDYGPVINEKQLRRVLGILERAEKQGAVITAGGKRLEDDKHAGGYYLAPTVVEKAGVDDEISQTELFAPVAVLYRVKDLKEAIELSNMTRYGLTSAIHTRDLNRAHTFAAQIRSGVVSINGGTFGSEPHLPFGGFKDSGNGTREPGTEALNVYSEWKNIYLNVQPDQI